MFRLLLALPAVLAERRGDRQSAMQQLQAQGRADARRDRIRELFETAANED